MGKKTRKTRWRTLTIQDEQSDSEESITPRSGTKKTYASKTVPRRRYQYDSTRSNSTTSDTKMTFNEDEYTRITTPRQDVLFKKGYLSKPKAQQYQTQTSTGNSTATSTGNGTPDYPSTDIEYESQFVFPNGFLDQNGYYYVNSFEPYPVMVYNPQYYPDYPDFKAKRYSTGSLSESLSPNNEENSSQDLSQSGGEAPQNPSFPDFQVYNMVYPYYINGVCPQPEIDAECAERRVVKRRRRKTSKSAAPAVEEGSTSEYSDQDSEDTTASKATSLETTSSTCTSPQSELEERLTTSKTDLKPDAEEFVPKAFRQAKMDVEEVVKVVMVQKKQVPEVVDKDKDIIIVNEPKVVEKPVVKRQYRRPLNNGNQYQTNNVSKQEQSPKRQWIKRTAVQVQVAAQSPQVQKIVPKPKNTTPVIKPTKPNQWISVSSKKKRKNRNVEELDEPNHEEQEVESIKDEEFESYDVSQLVDVVPSSLVKEPVNSTTQDKVPEAEAQEAAKVTEVVKETEAAQVQEVEQVKVPEIVVQEPDVQVQVPVQVQVEEVVQEEPRKKSKKGTQKPLKKRVIITDVDLSQPQLQIKEIVEETKTDSTVTKSNNVVEKVVSTATTTVTTTSATETNQVSTNSTTTTSTNSVTNVSSSNSAGKKKKKKQATTNQIAANKEQLDATEPSAQCSYDFLVGDNDATKTNIEVYQELDKLIQKGMYSSLEHKMRALQIDQQQDDFFRSMLNQLGAHLPAERTDNFAQAPDFSKILQSTRKLCTNSPTGFYPLRQMDSF